MAEPSVATQIERAISEELAKEGHTGTVLVRESFCELHTDAPVVAIDLGDWVGQWNLLPDDLKQERVERAVVRLVNALNLAAGKSAPIAKGELAERNRRIALVVTFVFVVGLLLVWLSRKGFFGGPETTPFASSSAAVASSDPIEESASAREARVKRVCEAMRDRIYQGGSLGMDSEGWVIEIWLAREADDLEKDEALKALVAKGMSEELGNKAKGALTIHPATAEVGLSTAIVRFSEGYVPPFFTPKGWTRYQAMAETFADASAATHAGMFARCAHLAQARDMGAWYRGADENGAVVSLLFAAGRHGAKPAFDGKKYAEEGLLAKLRTSVGAFDVTERDAILRKQGGRPHHHESKTGQKTVSLRFPLGGPTRAAAASRDVAAKLGL